MAGNTFWIVHHGFMLQFCGKFRLCCTFVAISALEFKSYSKTMRQIDSLDLIKSKSMLLQLNSHDNPPCCCICSKFWNTRVQCHSNSKMLHDSGYDLLSKASSDLFTFHKFFNKIEKDLNILIPRTAYVICSANSVC